jgi:hypothetical protein
MSLFNKRELLASSVRNRLHASAYETVLENANAKETIKAVARAFKSWSTYDIFLSHSYEDKVLINNVRESLVSLGYSVYVDWIEDGELDREKVTKETVNLLRTRMKTCKCLFYATSANATKSKWMPWELGYFDGYKNRVAVLPIVDTPESSFAGQEYLSVYPYVDKTVGILYIHSSPSAYLKFSDWLNGGNS